MSGRAPYDFVVGFTALLGKSPRSFALISGAFDAGVGRGVRCGAGVGVDGTVTGCRGALLASGRAPSRGPGELSPFGPGEGALPAFAIVGGAGLGPGLGAPAFGAGDALDSGPGAADCVGSAVARAIAGVVEGSAEGATLAAMVGRAEGTAVGAGGLGDGATDGAEVGTGLGAAVGGTFTVTATAAAVGTETGTAA